MAMQRTLVTSLISLLLLATGLLAAPTQADEPVDVSTSVTDRAKVLSGDEAATVRRAAADFYADTGQRLYVVYVRSFGDLSPREWAEKTATTSALGSADVLLAVATDDRVAASRSSAFTADDLTHVDRDAVRPALDDGDFAGAAVAAAKSYTDLADDSGLPWAWIVVGALALFGVGVLVMRRMRRRFEHTHHVLDEHGNPVDPAAILTLDELGTVAARSLVAVDDALRTSEQELHHADAQYGRHATTRFRVALDRAQASMREAFALHRRLGSMAPADDERRDVAARVIALCEEVDHALDAHVEAFDRLRDLESRVPAVLDDLAAQADALPTDRHDDQADRLLTTARAQIERSRTSLGDDDVRAAVSRLRAAEDSVAQATLLLAGTLPDDSAATAVYVETRRGAIGASARTCVAEATRLEELGDLDAATTLSHEGRSHAEADVAAWRGRREQKDDRGSSGFEAMVLGGILIDRRRSGGIGNVIAGVLGGSSHGGGSGTPYGGSSTPEGRKDRLRAPGSFGGTRTRGRRGGAGRF